MCDVHFFSENFYQCVKLIKIIKKNYDSKLIHTHKPLIKHPQCQKIKKNYFF